MISAWYGYVVVRKKIIGGTLRGRGSMNYLELATLVRHSQPGLPAHDLGRFIVTVSYRSIDTRWIYESEC